MSRCYLDANYLYAHLRQPRRSPDDRVARWRESVISELADDVAVVSALVFDELLYRLILAWLADDGVADPLSAYRSHAAEITRSLKLRLARTWRALDRLELELATTDDPVVARARQILTDPGLAPRDAFHAAHALEAGCEFIVSSDPDFDAVPGMARIPPPALR